MLKPVVLLNIFVETVIYLFFRILWRFFDFLNIINVFTVTFDSFNVWMWWIEVLIKENVQTPNVWTVVYYITVSLMFPKLTMIILTFWVTGFGLFPSSSSRTRAKWLSCQMGRPSRLSRDSWTRRGEWLGSMLSHIWVYMLYRTSYKHYKQTHWPLTPATHRRGRRSWTQSNWPEPTCSRNSTWSPADAHLQSDRK